MRCARQFTAFRLFTICIVAVWNLPAENGAAQSAPPIPTNALCPVLTDEPVDPGISVQYQGQTVYLCCQRCKKKFLEDPTPYLANLPQFLESANDGSNASIEAPAHETGLPSGEHEHEHGRESSDGWIHIAGKFHPLAIHFPIALWLAAALAELLGILRPRSGMTVAARYCLWLAALGAVVAATLGWAAASGEPFPGLENTLTWHRWLGTAMAAVAVVTLAIGEKAWRGNRPGPEKVYRTLLAAGVVLIVLTGHYGATLIYGPGYFGFK
jgi:uncharacterized membrane protein